MKHCINQTTQGCVLSGGCRCKNYTTHSYVGYSKSLADGKTEFGASYTLKGLIEGSNETDRELLSC